MRKEIGVDWDARYYKVIDLDTNLMIPDCIMADDKTGEYVVHAKDENGKYIVESDDGGNMWVKREFKKGNIKLIRVKNLFDMIIDLLKYKFLLHLFRLEIKRQQILAKIKRCKNVLRWLLTKPSTWMAIPAGQEFKGKIVDAIKRMIKVIFSKGE